MISSLKSIADAARKVNALLHFQTHHIDIARSQGIYQKNYEALLNRSLRPGAHRPVRAAFGAQTGTLVVQDHSRKRSRSLRFEQDHT
ncbi:hypothetical protein AOQ72_29485 [Bradyrhizobium yuanmingense]|uniref:Uncharacterized protein n=1 Tax=Bradyrhizobium yuanmingense TaxID=108015 RepID=A0A0R3C3K2_9BRAD|nr:hypothetical protein AOQ72_29485 [Bradyrhizobium yuanmingense]